MCSGRSSWRRTTCVCIGTVCIDINALITKQAIEKKVDLVYDTVGKKYVKDNVVPELTKKGYDVHVCATQVKVETAIARAEKRQRETGRGVDVDYLKKTYAEVKTILPEWEELARNGTEPGKGGVKDMFLFNNDGASLQLEEAKGV